MTSKTPKEARPEAEPIKPRTEATSNLQKTTPSTSTLSEDDLYLFNEGSHFRLFDHLGAHRASVDGARGVVFRVWAPDAREVSVIGDFNNWKKAEALLHPRGSSGIWEGFVAGVEGGAYYKYHIESRHNGYAVDKADPFAFYCEKPPGRASRVWDLQYDWQDQKWLEQREQRNRLSAPISIYEVHIGSWQRKAQEGNRSLSYCEMAPLLRDHVLRLGFTHVEFLPIMEHPFYGSWGYQTTAYFAPTSRYGTPQDFMFLVDTLHQAGIGVFLDWVPSHFPSDEHGLAYFDGSHLFEHSDRRQGFHPDWNTYIFNYSRHEVRSFLISSAVFWLSKYHIDGLRVDAVASMLYLDYSRREGEWIPNAYGGRENLEAIAFLRRLNQEAYRAAPGVQTIAEESTAWPMVSRPTYVGGLGFGLKWDMGWMHDTLDYMGKDPVFRKFHHNQLSFRSLYASHENFILALSHDEVVYGKGSLAEKMPGDKWRKLANLRLLYSYMFALPGKKLLFMGGELAQWNEWDHESSLQWRLEREPDHAGIARLLADLNRLYRGEPALHECDHDASGFEWVDANDAEQSCLSFLRKASDGAPILVVLNFTPVPRYAYCVDVPVAGIWKEIINSDATEYGGSGVGNSGRAESTPVALRGPRQSLHLTLPPLGALFLKPINATAEDHA
ncbi:MAG: 1,4-alpha-glucan branching protein GlgB [Deltaproteobacteria bacterium]|nr:1,4-alpha-glucan branching protein GlgB [Deltaproteobacteria bacterium]